MRRDPLSDMPAMVEAYRRGKSINEVAAEFHHSPKPLAAHLRATGVFRAPCDGNPWDSWPERQAILDSYAHGWSTHILAMRYHRDKQAISNLLRQEGALREARMGNAIRLGVGFRKRRNGNIHDLAVWFQLCKEMTGLYPDGAQVERTIDQLRLWNSLKPLIEMNEEVAM